MRGCRVLGAFFVLLAVSADGAAAEQQTALFAGGCFWCMEPPFDKLDGVLATTSGYAGGAKEDATYTKTSTGRTGHREVVAIEYDPARIGYAQLLEVFWRNIDPYDRRGQFCDKGPQYTSAVFALNDEQRRLAEESKSKLVAQLEAGGKQGSLIATEIMSAAEFYPAEDYHQDYYKKNPLRYKVYRWNCGRDARLEQIWGAAPEH